MPLRPTTSRSRRLLLLAFACAGSALPLQALRGTRPSFADPEEPTAVGRGSLVAEPLGSATGAASPATSEATETPVQSPDSGALRSETISAPLPPPMTSPLPPPNRRPAPIASRPRERAVLPILMYHHVNDLPRSNRDLYLRDLTVATRDFKAQLELLEARRATTVTLDALLSHLRGLEPLPERSVVLSFDDGYEDNYRLAFPLLRQYGMVGTFFVVANLVGEPGYMTWEQLRAMQRHGMSIESHSLDHIDLAIQPPTELRRQLEESRRMLQLNLLRAVRFLAYPSGAYSPRVIAEARAVGYEAAVTVRYELTQRASAPFELNRVRVKGVDTVESLGQKMVPIHWEGARGPFGR